MWAAIGAGISALSGLFGRKKDKPKVETQTNTVDYAGMVSAAEAAGFNPLTALRNGGTAGWTKSIGTSTGGPGSGGGSVGGAIANAAGQFATAFANIDPLREQKGQAEYDLMQAQLGRLADEREAHRRSMSIGGVPTRVAGQKVQGVGAASRPASTGINGKPIPWEDGKVSVTNPALFDTVDHTKADAEAAETRYSDPGGWLAGLRNIYYDFAASASQRARAHEKATGKKWDSMSIGDRFEAQLRGTLTGDTQGPFYTVTPMSASDPRSVNYRPAVPGLGHMAGRQYGGGTW